MVEAMVIFSIDFVPKLQLNRSLALTLQENQWALGYPETDEIWGLPARHGGNMVYF